MRIIKWPNGDEQVLDKTVISYLENKAINEETLDDYRFMTECNNEIEKTRVRKELDIIYRKGK